MPCGIFSVKWAILIRRTISRRTAFAYYWASGFNQPTPRNASRWHHGFGQFWSRPLANHAAANGAVSVLIAQM